MGYSSAIVMNAFIILLVIKWSTTAKHTFAGKINNQKRYSVAREIFLVLRSFSRVYTPKCLNIALLSDASPHWAEERTNQTVYTVGLFQQALQHYGNEDMSSNFPNTDSDEQINIVMNNMKNTKKILKHINDNFEKISPSSCVTFVLMQPPEPQLLSSLTKLSLSNEFTRYFIIYTRNMDEAEYVLLDERLREQENVVALTRLLNNMGQGYWQASIRQLVHHSGLPKVKKLNKLFGTTELFTMKDVFPEQMTNFYGLKFRGTTLNFKPFIDYQEIEGSRVVQPKPSLDVFILNVIAEKLNFTYEIVMPEDGNWAYVKEDVRHDVSSYALLMYT